MNPILRKAMVGVNAMHVWTYRASRGRVAGSKKGMPILLLTVPGRQTQIPRTAPVGYLQDGGRWIVSGSGGGLRDEPQWFRNLRAADHAVVEINGATRDVRVTVAEGEPRETLWRQLVAAYPFFTGYQEKVTRQIPVAVLQVLAEPVAGSVLTDSLTAPGYQRDVHRSSGLTEHGRVGRAIPGPPTYGEYIDGASRQHVSGLGSASGLATLLRSLVHAARVPPTVRRFRQSGGRRP